MIVPFVSPPLEAGCLAHCLALVHSGFQCVLVHSIVDGRCTCGDPECKKPGKHPIQNAWQKHTLRDESQVHDAFRQCRIAEPNLGIVLGMQPFDAYVLAIDVDNEARLIELEEELGALPNTFAGRSARGLRLFYTITNPPPNLVNGSGLGGKPGVDVKVHGGQVVVAPSLHSTGVRYTWVETPDKLAELPTAWCFQLPRKKTVAPPPPGYYSASKIERSLRERAQAYLDTIEPSIQGQNGSSRLMHAATCMTRGFGFDKANAFSMLANGYNHRCQPPWSAKEIEHKVNDAIRVGAMEWGALRDAQPAKKSNGTATPTSPYEPPTDPNGVVLPRIALIFDNQAPAKIATNVARLLEQHPIWRGGPRRDLFTDRIMWPDPLPDPLLPIVRRSNELCDEDELAVQGWMMSLSVDQRVRAGVEVVHAGVLHAARWRAYDSLTERVQNLPEWDRIERLGRWLTLFAGVEPTAVTEAFGRRWLIATIARALVPGCVADNVLVLEGATGMGKNRLITSIFGDAPWVQTLGKYRVGHDIEADWIANTSWIIHDDEMRARGSDLDALKSWISRRWDTYRKPYERNKQTYPRRAVMAGSTERDAYFHDETNRRFCPVKCGTIDWDGAGQAAPQLLSEAREAYRNGERWTIGRNDPLWTDFVDAQDERRIVDPMGDDVRRKLVALGMPEVVTVSLLADQLNVPPERRDRALETRIGIALRDSEYVRKRILRDGLRQYVYVRRGVVALP